MITRRVGLSLGQVVAWHGERLRALLTICTLSLLAGMFGR
jgi:hypothetical protein